MTTRLFGGGNNKNVPNYTGLQVQTSALNVPIAILYGRNRVAFNLIWWNDFVRHKHSSGKGGGKGQTFTYTVATLLGLCWGVVSSVPTVYTNQAKTTLANLGISLFSGTAGQAPFGYITANHPSQALSYPNIAYLASSSLNLDSSPILPSISLEVIGNLSGTMPGTDDVNMGDVIPDYLTNTLYGAGLESGNIDAVSNALYTTYVQAEGLFMSPVIVAQEKATDTINRWATITNTWIFWSGNQMKFVPLGDQAITANGVTYTPVNTVQYELGVGDFLDADSPVTVDRKDPADAYNMTRIQIKDRALDYNPNPVEYKDQTLIDRFGQRDNNGITSDEITTVAVGQKVITLIGKRMAYLRNTYSWRTSNRYIRLEPGDIVRLTDPTKPSVTALPVRIKNVDCDNTGVLTFTAEDYTGTVGSPIDQSVEPPSPTAFDTLVPPGDVNAPCIFEPDSSLNNGPAQVWITASGGQFWGGANVFISFNGADYSQIDTITSPAKQGVLTAPLASHADPDTVNTLAVDLTQSLQQLLVVNHADADAFRTLSMVIGQPIANVVQTDGELLAYGTVTTTGTYTDDLTYLRRGLYGSTLGAHSSGDQFTLIDLTGASGSLIRYAIPAQYIGQTIHVKFCSFNIYGLALQDLSSVVDYTYTPTGGGFGGGPGGVPTTPTGFAVSTSGVQNIATWSPNPVADNVTSYKLYRANGTGASFGSASVIWQGFATSYIDTDVSSGTGYTYFLSAVNAVGEGGHTAGVDATIGTVTYSMRVCAGTPGRKPNDGEVLFTIPMRSGDAIPTNMTGSEIEIDVTNGGVAPTSSWTITLYKVTGGVATAIFTGTIAGAATTGTWSAGAGVSFSNTDFLSAACISPQDATCEGISVTIVMTRTQ